MLDVNRPCHLDTLLGKKSNFSLLPPPKFPKIISLRPPPLQPPAWIIFRLLFDTFINYCKFLIIIFIAKTNYEL